MVPRRAGNVGPTKTQLWVLIAGFVFLGLSFIYLAVLSFWLIAAERNVPCDVRFLIGGVLALGVSIGSSFLGGYAVAQSSTPALAGKPITFGLGGGVAVFGIVLGAAHYFYGCTTAQPPEIKIRSVEAIAGPANTIHVSFEPVALPSGLVAKLQAAADEKFTGTVHEFTFDDPKAIDTFLVVPKNLAKGNVRFLILNADGTILWKGSPVDFLFDQAAAPTPSAGS